MQPHVAKNTRAPCAARCTFICQRRLRWRLGLGLGLGKRILLHIHLAVQAAAVLQACLCVCVCAAPQLGEILNRRRRCNIFVFMAPV